MPPASVGRFVGNGLSRIDARGVRLTAPAGPRLVGFGYVLVGLRIRESLLAVAFVRVPGLLVGHVPGDARCRFGRVAVMLLHLA